MSKRKMVFLALAGMIGISGTAIAAPSNSYVVGMTANGIGGSRHNLGAFGAHDTTTATTEICVFCHTPHHSNSKDTQYRPLWNRKNPTGFTAYGLTIGGTNSTKASTPILTVGSTSLACLSCHDGVTTLDNIVNAPGRDGYIKASKARGWEFFDDGISVGKSPVITVSGTRLNIGRDLRNDHPVSVPYRVGVASLRPRNTVISSINLTSHLMTSAKTFDAGNLSRNLWAVKGMISDSATIADLLRGNRVECSSCHDPHFSNATGASIDQGFSLDASSKDGLFLRRVGGNVGSGVCMTCHNKG